MKILRISYPTYSDVFYKFHLHFPGIKLFDHYVLYCVWIKHMYWYSVFRDGTAVRADLSTCVFVCFLATCENAVILHVTSTTTEQQKLRANLLVLQAIILSRKRCIGYVLATLATHFAIFNQYFTGAQEV